MHPVIAYVIVTVIIICYIDVIVASFIKVMKYVFSKASEQNATVEEVEVEDNEVIALDKFFEKEPDYNNLEEIPIPENVITTSGQHCEIFTNQCMGKGENGSVFVGKYWKTNKKVAVKVIRTYPSYTLAEEVENLKAVGFIHGVIGMFDYGFISDGRRIFMVLQYFEGGMNLVNYMKQNGILPLPTAMAAFWQLILAAESMLAAGVIHLDMQPVNLLYFKKTKTIRVCDLGIAAVRQGQAYLEDGVDFEFSPDDLCVLKRALVICTSTMEFSSAGDIYLAQLGRCLEYLLKGFTRFYHKDKASPVPVIPAEAQNLIEHMTWQGIYDRMRWKEVYDKEFVQLCKKAYSQQCAEASKGRRATKSCINNVTPAKRFRASKTPK